MQTPYALLLTALVSIVFFSLGWAAAWRMLARQEPLPTTEAPDTAADHLREWVGKQTKPFALSDAARGIGLPLEKLTPAVVTRLGIELKKLGCKRCFDADHKGLYSPLVREDQEAPTIKVPRQNVFIGTTNEADYAAPSNHRTSRAPYSKTFHTCSCGAVKKDDCQCISESLPDPAVALEAWKSDVEALRRIVDREKLSSPPLFPSFAPTGLASRFRPKHFPSPIERLRSYAKHLLN